jgi:glycosyltransferase involved in cell wall biosynthesis
MQNGECRKPRNEDVCSARSAAGSRPWSFRTLHSAFCIQMITLVLPWYGPDSAGGAESQARGLARALRGVGAPVRVWASTGRDSFHPGADAHYPAGHGELDGVPLWRWRPSPADERGVPRALAARPELPDLARFTVHELRLLGSLLGGDELYAAILRERDNPASRFVFLPYPFPGGFWGTALAPARSYHLACLHDEPYARYATYAWMFAQARGLLANSHAEADLARRLYGLSDDKICVAGEGIDLAPRGDGDRFRRAYGLGATPLLLYAGRRDEAKNTPALLAYAREYWARRGGALRLALMGPGTLDTGLLYAEGLADLVLDLGFVDEQTKHDAYAAADLFVQPSLHESFSIVLMEAWLQGAPALVHAGCAVTADHARRSGGGLSFDGFGQFAAALDLLLSRPDLRRALGQRGRAYVLETCDWAAVARRTADFVLGDR